MRVKKDVVYAQFRLEPKPMIYDNPGKKLCLKHIANFWAIVVSNIIKFILYYVLQYIINEKYAVFCHWRDYIMVYALSEIIQMRYQLYYLVNV